MPSDARAISTAEFAARYGIGIHKVLTLITAGVVKAIDCRAPGASRPQWRITPEAIEDFERRRSATPPAAKTRRTKKESSYTRYF